MRRSKMIDERERERWLDEGKGKRLDACLMTNDDERGSSSWENKRMSARSHRNALNYCLRVVSGWLTILRRSLYLVCLLVDLLFRGYRYGRYKYTCACARVCIIHRCKVSINGWTEPPRWCLLSLLFYPFSLFLLFLLFLLLSIHASLSHFILQSKYNVLRLAKRKSVRVCRTGKKLRRRCTEESSNTSVLPARAHGL